MTSSPKRHLIVTSDDYGYSAERDAGIRDCFIRGIVGHVSLMVNGVSAEEAVQMGKQIGLPMGLHLNLTEGLPVSEAPHSTLTGPDGFMHGSEGFRRTVRAGGVDTGELRREIQAQIDRYEKLVGHKPEVVDGHQHAHVVPGVAEVFATTLCDNSITKTRLPLEPEVSSHVWSSAHARSSDKMATFMKSLQQDCVTAGNVFKAHGIWSPGFTGLRTMGPDMSIDHLQACITSAFAHQQLPGPNTNIKGDNNVPDRSLVRELMCHPGNRTLHVGGCGNGADEFSKSADREHEMAVLAAMNDFYKANNIEVISFKHCQ